MSTIDVPVRLVIEADGMESFLVEMVNQEGVLKVGMCPICFSIVPVSRMEAHAEVVVHGRQW